MGWQCWQSDAKSSVIFVSLFCSALCLWLRSLPHSSNMRAWASDKTHKLSKLRCYNGRVAAPLFVRGLKSSPAQKKRCTTEEVSGMSLLVIVLVPAAAALFYFFAKMLAIDRFKSIVASVFSLAIIIILTFLMKFIILEACPTGIDECDLYYKFFVYSVVFVLLLSFFLGPISAAATFALIVIYGRSSWISAAAKDTPIKYIVWREYWPESWRK